MGLFKRFFKSKSHADVIDDIIYNLRLLADSEAGLAEFYGLCAGAAAHGKDFWERMSKSELRHQENIHKMIALIEKHPEDYAPGVSFNPASIRAFGLRVVSMAENVKSGNLSDGELYSMADEIEDSIVELDYSRIVKTGNAEFNKLVKEIDDESQEHRDSLKEKVTGWGGQ